MDSLLYFLWLLEQTFSGLLYIWPVTIGLILLLAFSVVGVLRKHKNEFRKSIKYLLVPLAGTIFILFLGTIYKDNPNMEFAVIFAVVYTTILSVISLYKTKAHLLLSVTSNALVLWFSFWSWFISAMSVSGNWL